MKEQPTNIIIGHGGYVVRVDRESGCVFVLRSDHRGVSPAGRAITFAEAGGEEKAVVAAVLDAYRLEQTAREEVRLSLSWAEGDER